MITKPKEELISDCLCRIFESYKSAQLLSQEGDDYACKNTHDKANKVYRVGVGDGDPPRKEYKFKICDKQHAYGACTYKCRHCRKKGHRSEIQKFPHMTPGYKRNRSLSGERKKPGIRYLRKPGILAHLTIAGAALLM